MTGKVDITDIWYLCLEQIRQTVKTVFTDLYYFLINLYHFQKVKFFSDLTQDTDPFRLHSLSHIMEMPTRVDEADAL